MSELPATYIRCSIPMDIYEQAASILVEHGLTPEEAVILLYRAIADTGTLPFQWPRKMELDLSDTQSNNVTTLD